MTDVIIIGSGLGGLLCAGILAKEGMKVCVIEKNKQAGGNLQTFSRNKEIFDTGVHYIGGLEKGQTLWRIFEYAGIMNKLKLKRMDEAFDHIMIDGQWQVYKQSQGYAAFIKNLVKDFPAEASAIKNYCNKIKDVCSKFPLYHLRLTGDLEAKNAVTSLSAKEVIEEITQNKTLQAVLAGNQLLYAGDAAKTPFHVHALIVNSYIESSWKCEGGGSQIAKALIEQIRWRGGSIIKNTEVKKIVEENGRITGVQTEEGKIFGARFVISNISPTATINMTPSPMLKTLYRKRISELEQTVSSFSLYLVLKKKSVPYKNHNYYFHKNTDVWSMNRYTDADWPRGYGLYFTQDKNNPGFASSASVLTIMRFADVALWEHTYNRVGKQQFRGDEYEIFKQQKTAKLLAQVEKRFPGFLQQIEHCYAATPLTHRDYIGTPGGSMYGIQKDFHQPVKTIISPRTKIPNLFLTGQNINLHGILGTSLSAILTCSMLLGDDGLMDRIRNCSHL